MDSDREDGFDRVASREDNGFGQRGNDVGLQKGATVTVTRLAVGICLAVVIVGADPAIAECLRAWKDIPDAKRLAALVFSGTVIEIKPDPDGVFVVFDVDRVWKGSLRKRLVLPIWNLAVDSYFPFQKGGSYVVFASRHHMSPDDPGSMRVPTVSEPVFEVSPCGATRALSDAKAVLGGLGRGSRPK